MYSIAIDGPAGAGKSTIAKAIAEDIGFIYVDTGAMYRAIALYFLRKGIDGHDRKLVAAECPNIHVTLEYDEEGKQQVILNGENVTGYIRKEEVGKMASVTSAVPEVRAALLDLQRDMAKTSDILMDGRDIGTNVLPDASLKIYLTASADVRAKRRYDELKEKGADCDIEQIKTDIIARDKQDMEREIAPLCQAEVLYQKALDAADLKGGETVIDAYCGTGTISLCLAKKARRVIGIEIVREAIEDAKKNAAFNHIENAEFHAADAGLLMPKLYEEGLRPDVIVMDPVRAGCSEDVLKAAAGMQPARIVYVSCNPATFARDAEILGRLGYKLQSVQPVDMFPQTTHVECVALMSRTGK